MYRDDERLPNSNECVHNGRKLSNTVAQVKASERIVQVCIGADDDDQFDALVENSPKEGRVKIGLEIAGGEDWFEIDLEDILRFARKYCNGVYERVRNEENVYVTRKRD